MGATHRRRQPLAAFHLKYVRGLRSFFPVFHMPPRTEYRTKDNTHQFQNVSTPGTQNVAETSTDILKQYDTQGDNGGGGYKRDNSIRHLCVIARYEAENDTHKGSGCNHPGYKNNVCTDNGDPIHIRRCPERINKFFPVDSAECHSNRKGSCIPSRETCRNRDDPSK